MFDKADTSEKGVSFFGDSPPKKRGQTVIKK